MSGERPILGGPRDRAALALAAVFLVLAVAVGIRTGFGVQDVDEAVFRQTLAQMHDGDGYYDAMHDALIVKEGRAPSNARAYRPPAMFVLLAPLPDGSLRFAVALPFVAMLLAAWRLGRPYGEWGGTTAVVLVGVWIVGAAPYLFLHAEVWGGGLFLVGLALARSRTRTAGVVLGAAVLVRELFAPAFLVGLVLHRRKATWWMALAALVGLTAVHLHLAGQVLDPDGYQPPLHFTGRYLEAISPGDQTFGLVVGVVGGIAGLAGTVLAWKHRDPAAQIVLFHNLSLVVLTVLFGRTYWSYAFGPSNVVFAAVTLQWLKHRRVGSEPSNLDFVDRQGHSPPFWT